MVKLDSLGLGKKFSCYIIAEVGINHNGDLKLAKKLIDEAAAAGANAVKFQKRTIDLVYNKEYLNEPRISPFGSTQGDLKRGLEFDKKQYKEIKDYCSKKNITLIISPWDEKSVDFICNLGVSCIKIPSPCLHDANLLKHIASKRLPVILSVGMSDQEQIIFALNTLAGLDIVLTHCVSSYPTADQDVNMNRLKTLMKKFPDVYAYGYSGHELSSFPPILAVSIGAKLIEKHITLDKDLWGSDQKVSLNPNEFKNMIRDIRTVEIMLGNDELKVLKSEVPAMIKLQRKRKINAVIFDTDGVLTDGNIYKSIEQDSTGRKAVNYKNLDAFNQFKKKGYTTIIISKEGSATNGEIVNLFNPDIKMFDCTDKWDSINSLLNKLHISPAQVSYIGDSYSDLDVFRNLTYTFAPADAIPEIKQISHKVLSRRAEDGCLVEALIMIETINRGL